MVNVIQKMGWLNLSLVVSASKEGCVFADAVKQLAREKKWRVFTTMWIQGDETVEELSMGLRNVTRTKSDVIIGHIRERSNEDIFRTIQDLQAIDNNSAWLVSDVTTRGILDLNLIPAGMLRISAKSPEMGHDYELYVNVLYDSFVMIESAFKKSVAELSGDLRREDSSVEKNKLLQGLAVK